MSALEIFKKLLRSLRPTDTGSVVTTDPFVVVDRPRAIEKLKLEERATRNGARNYPAAESTNLDEVEQDIVAEFQQLAARAQSEAASNHKVYGQRLSELSLLRELAGITTNSTTAHGDFRNLVMNVRGRLALAEDEVRDSYQELMDFKADHGLKRPAYKGVSGVVAWSTFLISGIVESVLNSLMLKVNDDYGYLGGFLAAVVISSINVGMAAFVGRFLFPSHYHKSLARKIFAWVLTSAWIAFALLWNLLAAHFRDVKAAGMEMPEKQALVEFINGPWQLDSIYSYGLLVLGIIFSIVAAITALKMKDPYPGYGELYQRHEDRCREYADKIEDATDELTVIRDEATSGAGSIRNQLSVQFGERGRIIASREFHRSSYHNHQRHLEETCNGLLDYYRDRNRQARTDARFPSHFNQRYPLNFNELPHPADEPTTEAEVLTAQNSLSKAITSIGAAYDEAIHSFKHLDLIKQELRRG